MYTLEVVVRAHPGTRIDYAAVDVARLSAVHDLPIDFSFNGTPMVVAPGTGPEAIIAAYWDLRSRPDAARI